ncbi:lactose regulatory protein LAC9 [Stachybotrys elegans]|uniref:Lactose regulatory protein LAC9 n=1 Tax=Stachybotrys elegans TaxID=80388 RepID=A0A8K0S9V6_9HYPO|nr:lactose regulatory protein LAC9 [Stachybotrys elegans]
MDTSRPQGTSLFACTKQRPSCQTCLQNRQTCHYSGRITRSPLTRAHLTAVEHRLQRMESLFAHLHPEFDLENALAATSATTMTRTATPKTPRESALTSDPSLEEPHLTEKESISETVPDEADGFDWREDIDDIADGMAALAIEPKGTGYLGSTAGVFFLRAMLYHIGYTNTVVTPCLLPSGHSPTFIPGLEASDNLAHSILSRQTTERLIDAYFSLYHSSYPFIHEATFRAQFHEVIPRPRSYDTLMYTVLALGAWCFDEENAQIDVQLYRQAMPFGEDETLFERADLTLVQALILLSNLSQKLNKPNTGANLLGLATRMALSLGLHRELPDWDISLLQREMRRRAWWGLYIFDSGASTTFGRPILLPGKESMDVQLVLNIHDGSLTPRTPIIPTESPGPTLYSGLKYQSSLHLHSNYISNALLSSTSVSAQEAMSMNRTLDSWMQSLPGYFGQHECLEIHDEGILFAKHRLWWRFWNLKIILFRNFLLSRAVEQRTQSQGGQLSDIETKCRDVAVSAASDTISSISSFLDKVNITRLVTWYSIFFMFHASLVTALAILGNSSSPDVPKWQDDLDKVRHVLRKVFGKNPLALRCAAVLDVIVQPVAPMSGADLWIPGDVNPSIMDFSTWPLNGADPLTLFGWPEQDPAIP